MWGGEVCVKHVHLELATAAFSLFQVPTGITVVPYNSAQVEESEDSCTCLATQCMLLETLLESRLLVSRIGETATSYFSISAWRKDTSICHHLPFDECILITRTISDDRLCWFRLDRILQRTTMLRLEALDAAEFEMLWRSQAGPRGVITQCFRKSAHSKFRKRRWKDSAGSEYVHIIWIE